MSFAAAAALVGELHAARSAVTRILEVSPRSSLSSVARHPMFGRQEDVELFLSGLRKAGLPE